MYVLSPTTQASSNGWYRQADARSEAVARSLHVRGLRALSAKLWPPPYAVPGDSVPAERLPRGLGPHARPATPLGTHLPRFDRFRPWAQTACHALRSAVLAPTRALRPDAPSSWGGRGECGLGGHPPAPGACVGGGKRKDNGGEGVWGGAYASGGRA